MIGKIAQCCTQRPAKLSFKQFEMIDQASRPASTDWRAQQVAHHLKITKKKKIQVVPIDVGRSAGAGDTRIEVDAAAAAGEGGKNTTQNDQKKVDPKNLRNWMPDEN